MTNIFLNFSDAAKFSDIARNISNGFGFMSMFSFWGQNIFSIIGDRYFNFLTIPPVMPYSISTLFKVFGVTDFAVVATSFFYFILTLVFVYLFAKKLFISKLAGVLSALVVGASYDIIHYATNGASESPFIFEIVAASYFATLKKKWANMVMVLFLVLLYFTRPQAFIYISGIILYWLLVNLKPKKAVLYFVGVLVAGVLVDYFVLIPLSGKFFLYSIFGRGLSSSFSQSSVASDALRGGAVPVGFLQVLKNIFYNLYNFYKALPDIINPYFFTLFGIGLFVKSKSKEESSFKVASVFMVAVTLLVTAASIPFYRYIHPIIPLVYILAVGTMVEILRAKILNRKLFIVASISLVLFFGVGQTVGKFVLDSRFEAKTHNVGKPPVYVELSYILRDNTDSNQVIITNLDTWGSWYGERKTVWFPLEPKQLIDPDTGKIIFDAIYLTSYLIDDANYYMGDGWRMIFNNPNDSKKWTCDGCDEIAKEFVLKGVYSVSADADYERQDATSILLIKK